MARIFGYTRTADYEETLSLDAQQELIQEKASYIDGTWQGCRAEHGADPWCRRPEFTAILEDLESGDHLVVHDLRRLDPRQEDAVEAVQTLVDRQIHIHVLELKALGHGSVQLDLDPAAGRSFLKLWRAVLSYFAQAHRDTVRDALQYRREIGLAYNAHPPFGKKRVVRNGLTMDVWDERQCCLIREIKDRHDSGESILSIARDFYRRRERTGIGEYWVRRYGKNRRLNANRLYRAYKWYSELLASGSDLWAVSRWPRVEETEPQ